MSKLKRNKMNRVAIIFVDIECRGTKTDMYLSYVLAIMARAFNKDHIRYIIIIWINVPDLDILDIISGLKWIFIVALFGSFLT